MSDYIERKVLYQAFLFYAGKRIPEVDVDGLPITIDLQTIKKTIRELPSANVGPSRARGRWIERNPGSGAWRCSECQKDALCNGVEEDVKSEFCPHCGAHMERSGSGEAD